MEGLLLSGSPLFPSFRSHLFPPGSLFHSHANRLVLAMLGRCLHPRVCAYYSFCPGHLPFPTIDILCPQVILRSQVRVYALKEGFPDPKPGLVALRGLSPPRALTTPRNCWLPSPSPPQTKLCGIRVCLGDCYTPRADSLNNNELEHGVHGFVRLALCFAFTGLLPLSLGRPDGQSSLPATPETLSWEPCISLSRSLILHF